MGTNTLNARASGQTILDTFFNDFNTAFGGDLIGRNNVGVPTGGQNLGTVAIPWGSVFANTIVLNGTAVDVSKIVSPVNRIISGKKRSTSNQPAFIVPNGAAPSFLIAGASTSLAYDVNGIAYTISTDITKGSLTTAPSSQNTALVNDTSAAGQEDTRLWGEPEHRKSITIDTVGSNITSKVGKFAAFKIGAEYFIALVESTTKLSHARRGYFYDASSNPMNRVVFSDDDTITLMSLGWVFIDADQSTIDVSYNNPTWSNVAPGSPATGDYWYDFSNKEWKRYDGASFVIINRTFAGNVIIDTANCVGARCENFYAAYSSENSLGIELSTTEIAIALRGQSKVSVAGNLISFGEFLQTWNITTDLAGSADMYNATEQASTLYYLYLRDDGRATISDISPYYRDDFFGQYHPHNPWRCIGSMYNDGSSNVVQAGDRLTNGVNEVWLNGGTGGAHHGSSSTSVRRFKNIVTKFGAAAIYVDSVTLGGVFTITEPGLYDMMYVDSDGSGLVAQICLNSTNADLTTAFSTLSTNTGISINGGTSGYNEATAKKFLKIGDVIRFQDGGTGTQTLEIAVQCRIVKVS